MITFNFILWLAQAMGFKDDISKVGICANEHQSGWTPTLPQDEFIPYVSQTALCIMYESDITVQPTLTPVDYMSGDPNVDGSMKTDRIEGDFADNTTNVGYALPTVSSSYVAIKLTQEFKNYSEAPYMFNQLCFMWYDTDPYLFFIKNLEAPLYSFPGSTWLHEFTFYCTSGLTGNFFRMLAGLFGAESSGLIDSTGAIEPAPIKIREEEDLIDVKAPLGEDSYGILVGTGESSFTGDNYNLDTPATGITYGATEFIDCSTDELTKSWLSIRRSVTNSSASTVSIKEIGLMASLGYLMFYLPINAINIEPGDTITLELKIQIETDEINVFCYVICPAGNIPDEESTSSVVYSWVKRHDYIHLAENAVTYSQLKRLLTGNDGNDIYLIGNSCYREIAGYEQGTILSPYINGRMGIGHHYSDKAMTVYPILIGDRISGSPLTTPSFSLVPYAKNGRPGLRADFIQLQIEPDGDFNFLTVEILDGKK